MSLRRLAVLALLLAAAGTYYYLVEVKGAGERAAREAEAKQLFHFEIENVAAVEWRRGEDLVRLAKREGQWRVVSPVDERADELAVSGALNALAKLTPARVIEQPGAADEYGLAEPGLVLEAQTAEGSAVALLKIGAAAPDGQHRFVRSGEEPAVGLVPTGTYGILSKDLFALRSKQWTTATPAQVQAVRFQGATAGVDVRAERAGDDAWVVGGAAPKPADAARIQSVLNRLLNARISEVAAETVDDPATYGFDAPGHTVTFTLEGATATLQFGTVVPDSDPVLRYARVGDDPRALVFAGTVLDGFPTGPSALRDRTLLAFARGDIRRIAITNGDETLAVGSTGVGKDWFLEGAEPVRADAAEVSALLGQIERLQASGFLEVGEEPVHPADFDAAPLTLVLDRAGEAPPLRVRFAQGEATQDWYALRDGDSEAYPVDQTAVEGLRTTREDLRDRHVLRFDESAVQRIEVQRGPRTVQFLRQDTGEWSASPRSAALDEYRIDQLLVDLADMKYARLLEPDNPTLALGPELTIALFGASDTALGTLRVAGPLTGPAGERQYAVDAAGLTAAIDARFVTEWSAEFTPADD